MGVYECGICMCGDEHMCRSSGILFSCSLADALEAGFLTEPGAQLVVSRPSDLPVSVPPPEWCYKPVTHPALLHVSGSKVTSPCMSSQHFYPSSCLSIPCCIISWLILLLGASVHRCIIGASVHRAGPWRLLQVAPLLPGAPPRVATTALSEAWGSYLREDRLKFSPE